MYILIGIFYASILGIFILIVLKMREVKTGNKSLVSRLGQSTDQLFHGVFSKIRTLASYINKRTFIALAHWIAFHILYRVRNVYVELKHRTLSNQHGRRIINAVRGRGEVSDTGASIYLRRISTDDVRK